MQVGSKVPIVVLLQKNPQTLSGFFISEVFKASIQGFFIRDCLISSLSTSKYPEFLWALYALQVPREPLSTLSYLRFTIAFLDRQSQGPFRYSKYLRALWVPQVPLSTFDHRESFFEYLQVIEVLWVHFKDYKHLIRLKGGVPLPRLPEPIWPPGRKQLLLYSLAQSFYQQSAINV